MLSVNELKKKYKGAALGPIWALIKPTFTLFILWFAFEIGLKETVECISLTESILSSFSCSPAMCRGFIFQNVSLMIEVNKKQQAVCNKAVIPCFKYHDLYLTFGTLYPHFAVCYNVCGAAVSGLWTEYLQSSVYLLCADDVFFLPCAFVDDCSSQCVQQGF